ncbi:MAG: hypothetical protein HY892_00190 [Deltaproteobacteria bacterium]|nr:hypothetical protein [Deltaproteobacteria bacterium]
MPRAPGSGRSLGLPRPQRGERGNLWRLFLIGLFLVSIIPGAGWAGERAPLTAEQQEVAAAARRYLEAEVKQDHQTVFRSLYPASEYRKANNFEAYLAEARSTPVGIESFEILGVSILPEIPDREKWPEVNGFARVEVDLVIHYTDTDRKSLANYNFPFVRSGGKWYKL